MLLGTALIIGALSLFLFNRQEEAKAGQAVAELLPQLVGRIEESSPEETQMPVQPLDTPTALEMTEVEIDGYAYIGYLSIPRLGVELPVMADWDYARLRTAPCRYAGSVWGEDLVIMAHNYASHFGGLSDLETGDSVVFTDMDGNEIFYQVAAQDILAPTAVAEMTSGTFDLTLFTCTYGGQNRVTVYCDLASNKG